MAEGINKAYLIGNLGADAEMRSFPSGTKLTFRLATSERWRDKDTGEKKERTEWHRCVLWGARAERLAPHLTKGTTLFVEGRMETHSYEKDGHTKYTTEVRVAELKFIASSKPGPSAEASTYGGSDWQGAALDGPALVNVIPPPLPHPTVPV